MTNEKIISEKMTSEAMRLLHASKPIIWRVKRHRSFSQ